MRRPPNDGEPPARPHRGRVRRLSVAPAIAFFVLSGLSGCSDGGPGGDAASAASVADTPHVAPDEETFFTDLPGIDGFDALSPDLQAAVTARANRAKCDCGCFGHSVNACLHQREACEIAERIALRFVADARLGSDLAASAPAPGGDTAAAPAAETGAVQGTAPAGESAADAGSAPSGESGVAPETASAPSDATGASAPAGTTAAEGSSAPEGGAASPAQPPQASAPAAPAPPAGGSP